MKYTWVTFRDKLGDSEKKELKSQNENKAVGEFDQMTNILLLYEELF